MQEMLTVVFMIPVPCVLIELAMCRILIVFKCLLLLVLSMKICKEKVIIIHSVSKPASDIRNTGLDCISPDYWDYRGSAIQKHEYFSWFPKHPDPETTWSINNFHSNSFLGSFKCIHSNNYQCKLFESIFGSTIQLHIKIETTFPVKSMMSLRSLFWPSSISRN